LPLRTFHPYILSPMKSIRIEIWESLRIII